MYQRSIVDTLVARMNETRRFIQILIGPRQTGKTTSINQALEHIEIPSYTARSTSTGRRQAGFARSGTRRATW